MPVHASIASLLESPAKRTGRVFKTITERQLLKWLKELCRTCGFSDPGQYKLHSFRHHFASLCANHNVAYRKALAWLGHSSSQMLGPYYHLHDEDSQQAMETLAESAGAGASEKQGNSPSEGNRPFKNRENTASPEGSGTCGESRQ